MTQRATLAPSPAPPQTIPIAPDSVAVIVAAGDIACGDDTSRGAECGQAKVAELIRGLNPIAVLLLGDIQYENGTLAEFRRYYDASWGAFKSITWPAPGNHEYRTSGASGYFDYFNGEGAVDGRAGVRGRGYYSVNIGTWHLVALNSNCDEIGGCEAGSPQEQWLRADLAASTAPCTLAWWHHPRFSSGGHGDDRRVQPLWQTLYEHGPAVVLNGHDHDYERFARMTPDGVVDTVRGLQQFVVGTGGKEQLSISRARANSAALSTASLGVLELTLRADSYAWRFVQVRTGVEGDSGVGWCAK